MTNGVGKCGRICERCGSSASGRDVQQERATRSRHVNVRGLRGAAQMLLIRAERGRADGTISYRRPNAMFFRNAANAALSSSKKRRRDSIFVAYRPVASSMTIGQRLWSEELNSTRCIVIRAVLPPTAVTKVSGTDHASRSAGSVHCEASCHPTGPRPPRRHSTIPNLPEGRSPR